MTIGEFRTKAIHAFMISGRSMDRRSISRRQSYTASTKHFTEPESGARATAMDFWPGTPKRTSTLWKRIEGSLWFTPTWTRSGLTGEQEKCAEQSKTGYGI